MSFILYFLICLICIFLGVLPLIKNPKKTTSISFFITAFFIAIWSFSIYMFKYTEHDLLFWARLTFVGPIVFSYSVLVFCLALLQKIKLFSFKNLLIILPTLLLLIFIPTDFIVQNVRMDTRSYIYGLGHKLFALYFVLYISSSIFVAIKGIYKFKGLEQQRLKYFITGVALACFSGGITNLLFPLLGNNQYSALGPLFVIFFLSFTVYAIIKHQLLDISVIINRTAAYALAVLLFGSIYLSFVFAYVAYFTSNINAFFLGISILYGLFTVQFFPYVWHKIQNTSEKIFFPSRSNYQKMLLKTAKELGECISLQELKHILESNLVREMNFSNPHLYLAYKKQKPDINHLMQELKQSKETKVRDFLEAKDELKAELSKLEAQACVPCFSKNELQGLLLLGTKTNQRAYSIQDFNFLETLSYQIGATLERAQPYEKLKSEYEKAMQVTEKMSEQAAYATLTRRVAHEINNPLAMILGQSILIKKYQNQPEKVAKNANAIYQSVERLSHILQIMLKYGSQKSRVSESLNINELLEEICSLARADLASKEIKVAKDLAADLPLIKGDSNRLHQVFLNIILNAVQAIHSKGAISIITRQADFTNKAGMRTQGIEIKVENNGPEIPATIQQQIFDTFFTTKKEGLGLGLSITLNIINEHDGMLSLTSDSHKTTFTVYLPRG
mgnify:CR=1 FL=1